MPNGNATDAGAVQGRAEEKAPSARTAASIGTITTRGVYKCVCCGARCSISETKFESGNRLAVVPGARRQPRSVNEEADNSLFMRRTEVTCAACDAHLGHAFRRCGLIRPANAIASIRRHSTSSRKNSAPRGDGVRRRSAFTVLSIAGTVRGVYPPSGRSDTRGYPWKPLRFSITAGLLLLLLGAPVASWAQSIFAKSQNYQQQYCPAGMRITGARIISQLVELRHASRGGLGATTTMAFGSTRAARGSSRCKASDRRDPFIRVRRWPARAATTNRNFVRATNGQCARGRSSSGRRRRAFKAGHGAFSPTASGFRRAAAPCSRSKVVAASAAGTWEPNLLRKPRLPAEFLRCRQVDPPRMGGQNSARNRHASKVRRGAIAATASGSVKAAARSSPSNRAERLATRRGARARPPRR
mgnify:CR=1 FL=1